MKKLVVGMLLCAMVLLGNRLYAESFDNSKLIFCNIEFGAGLSQRFNSEKAKVCLESHYLLKTKGGLIGPMLFIDSDNFQTMESLGYGIMWELPIGAQISYGEISLFNLGIGVMKGYGTLVFSTTF